MEPALLVGMALPSTPTTRLVGVLGHLAQSATRRPTEHGSVL
ncbi:hypothetical protein [Streptomyces sp. NBC_01304]|nr:hypothetical protein OG430_47170 [Streptomyces sp. NBC_01304]